MPMSGMIWAVIAGVGFGVFQSVNRRAVSGMDVFLATFLQLLISSVVLAGACLISIDLSLLRDVSVTTLISFALAGFIHFFIGWTFLNVSQKRIGASRTSPLIGTTPLFAAVIASFTLGEFPDVYSWIGIVLMVVGVYVVSRRSSPDATSASMLLRGSMFGLAAALCWAISPVFTREGLKGLSSPLLGVTIGMLASAIGYGVLLLWRRSQGYRSTSSNEAFVFKIVAGVLVGLSTWWRWIALDLAPVAEVLALSLVSVPLVIVLSPLVSGKQLEQVTAMLWIGAALIVGGALVLILSPS